MLKGVIPVAVKVLKDQSYTSREEFQREVGLLKSLHNSNIVQFQVWRLATRCHACPAGHTLWQAHCEIRRARRDFLLYRSSVFPGQ